MKKQSKLLILVLTLAMLFSVLGAFAITSSAAGTSSYVKVTEAPTDWSGEYLIVYENESLIFDGSLSSLDASNNYQSVTISNNTIEADPKYQFVIDAAENGYTIKSASGYYIGNTANSNKLNSSTSTNCRKRKICSSL